MIGIRRVSLCLGILAGTAAGDFSPLSIHPEGYGIPVAPMGARERGMGEAGMAALTGKGYFLPNASRSAFYERTSFVATFESDLDWLRDDATSNRMLTHTVPTLATTIKTRKFGSFGLHYQQSFHRNFSLFQPAETNGGVEEEFAAEGAQALLGLSWGFSPIPLLAFGISHNFALGRDRFIRTATFREGVPPEVENQRGDTLEMRHRGDFPTLSMTVHTRRIDAALAYTPATDLRTSQERKITGIFADAIPDTTRDLPFSLATGIAWRASPRHTLALDFSMQDWQGSRFLNTSFKTSLGWERRGTENPYEEYYKRLTFRAGLGHEILYLRETPEYFGTLGLGLPLGPRGHGLDLSMRYGHRSFDGDTFFSEDDVKISASVVGVGIWGQPIRKRR
jgi:long-chain fatty acid transport protein